MQCKAANAIAEVDQRNARVAGNDAVGLLVGGDRRQLGGARKRLVGARAEIKVLRTLVAKPRRASTGQQSLDGSRDGRTQRAHPFHHHGHAGGIPKRKRPELPIEASRHRPIDLDDRLRDLADAVGRIGPKFREDLPVKPRGLVHRRVACKQSLQTRGQRLVRLRLVEGRDGDLACSLVFQGLRVQHQARLLSFGALFFLIETLPRLVAQPLALDQLRDHLGQHHIGPLVGSTGGKVARHAAQDIQAHHVRQAKGTRLRPANHLTREQVDLFDRQSLFLHDLEDVQHGKGADTIGDKVLHVIGGDHGLAQLPVDKG